MKNLSDYITETVIKNQNDLKNMRFLLVNIKSMSSEKYTVDAFENVISALNDLDVESARANLEKFIKDTNVSAVMINQQYILCKIGKTDIKNIVVKKKSDKSNDTLG